ncbi:hypothetical protein [Dermatobacter hominis]|uniref:hypothetical protein n=1 Tax=Dermatobacter hominis TaxID=2884263 RepID=UPI001D129D3B|nr:hypothetical protein [Dermatobacter hominis]UDY34806.1 hypothetical protein LH044_15870 [Dermatobacter hominis]
MKTRGVRFALVGLVAAFAAVAAACAPAPSPGAPPAPINWSFKGTNMTVNNVQDEVCVLVCVNTSDEAYLLQVAFRVRIGEPGSAQAWVVKGGTLPSTGAGGSRSLNDSTGAKVAFNGVQPLDVLDALNSNNKMDVVGTYTWAAEEDFFDSLTGGAESIANIFETALNSTLAAGSLPNGDTNALIGLIIDALFDNVGTPFNLILANLPCLGTCDDVLGGALYVGLGATGTLASLIDTAIGSTTIPSIPIPAVTVPPDVQGGGLYTMASTKNFNQVFSGADGVHTYSFQSGPA